MEILQVSAQVISNIILLLDWFHEDVSSLAAVVLWQLDKATLKLLIRGNSPYVVYIKFLSW